MYQVLARKYRPRNFDELVGQPHVARTLTNAIRNDRLAHAYIFAGQRGTGKTTVARILAKCLNCEEGPAVKPCDRCAPCMEIAAGRAIDVLEIDAASRTKVEQTRELLEMIAYAPARDRHKIVIIDEVHMLSAASFNALLKTLEEPPPNVVFILATTEIQKILPTILSRCQVFEFRRVGVRELAEHLRRICGEEGIRISDAALERIARAGEGSVRDSLSFLERALAFCGKEIDEEEVLRMLGGVRAEVLIRAIDALARRSTAEMLAVLDDLIDEGHDLLHFWNELIAALRDLLLLRVAPGRKNLLGRAADEAGALEAAATPLTDEDLIRAFQLLADLEPALKSSAQPRFMFESALIRLGSLGAVRPIEEVLQNLAGGALAPSSVQPEAAPAGPGSRPENAPPTPADGGDLGSRLVASLARARPMIGAILQRAESFRLDDDRLRIRFPPGSASLVAPLQRRESLAVVESHAAKLAGRPVKVEVEFAEGVPPGGASGSDAGASRRRRSTAPSRPSTKGAGHGSLIERAKSEPGVRKLLREFGAQVVDIRPMGTPDDPAMDPGPSDSLEENS